MSSDQDDHQHRLEARDRRLKLLRAAGYVPILEIVSQIARSQQLDTEVAWLKIRGELCSGEVTAFIIVHELPAPVPKEKWFSSATDDVGQTGKLILKPARLRAPPPMGVAHDGVMNRLNLNPGAIIYGAIDVNGRLKIQPIMGDPFHVQCGVVGTFTVFVGKKALALLGIEPAVDQLCSVRDEPNENVSSERARGRQAPKRERVVKEMRAAAARRFNLVPFTRKPAKVDPEMTDKLMAEAPAILRWMIDGCLDWQAHGLARPDSIKEATEAYFDEQDVMSEWMAEKCIVDRHNEFRKATTQELFSSWSTFAKANNEVGGTVRAFSQKLQKFGFQQVKNVPQFAGGRARGFAGIEVRSDAAQTQF